MCDALVDDKTTGKRYIQGFTTYKTKKCSRKQVVSVGALKLCRKHGQLAKEGFISPGGQSVPATQVRDCRNRRNPDDRHMHDWALDLPVVSLLLPPT